MTTANHSQNLQYVVYLHCMSILLPVYFKVTFVFKTPLKRKTAG